ncbi:MAG: hypothetical protein HXX09_06520 [Bacteroidetes bacterium]|nr:hypothetical protein [Bacteroidota bacterium]
MKIIIDSGSTKTEWAIISNEGNIKRLSTKGMNPYFINEAEIIDIIQYEISNNIELENNIEIFFYGAGCSNSKNKEIIKSSFASICDIDNIKVETDILGAAKALFGKESGIACILGTGSNTCIFDGEKIIESKFSTGYIFGDEGSGSHLGKSFISLYLNDKMPPEIIEKFNNKFGISKEDILNHVYKQPFPNRFLASFCEFLKENIQEEFIEMLVIKCFIEFFENSVLELENYKDKEIGFVGSIAFEFEEQLKKTALLFEIKIGKIIKSPIGELEKFHSN